jgi:phosphopantetheinyl transferase
MLLLKTEWIAPVQNTFSLKDSADILKIRYHCNESDKRLPAAIAMNGNICSEQLRSNLGLFFHPREVTLFRQIANTDRANEFLMGRFVAKRALALLFGKESYVSGTESCMSGEESYMPGAENSMSGKESYNRICIDRGTFMQPILLANGSGSLDISITHKRDMIAAIAFPKSHPTGIDLEKIEPSSRPTLESQMTKPEILAVASSAENYLNALWQLWVVKEAVSKVLKTGLTTSFLLFETCKHSFNKRGELSCYFSHFYQYHAQSWILDDHVLAVVHPRTASFDMDIRSYNASHLLPSEKLP